MISGGKLLLALFLINTFIYYGPEMLSQNYGVGNPMGEDYVTQQAGVIISSSSVEANTSTYSIGANSTSVGGSDLGASILYGVNVGISFLASLPNIITAPLTIMSQVAPISDPATGSTIYQNLIVSLIIGGGYFIAFGISIVQFIRGNVW
jgi:hypothetical protein